MLLATIISTKEYAYKVLRSLLKALSVSSLSSTLAAPATPLLYLRNVNLDIPYRLKKLISDSRSIANGRSC